MFFEIGRKWLPSNPHVLKVQPKCPKVIPIWPQSKPKLPPKCPKVAPKCPKVAPKWLPSDPKVPQSGSQVTQNGSQVSESYPQVPQSGSKVTPSGSQVSENEPQMTPKRLKLVENWFGWAIFARQKATMLPSLEASKPRSLEVPRRESRSEINWILHGCCPSLPQSTFKLAPLNIGLLGRRLDINR